MTVSTKKTNDITAKNKRQKIQESAIARHYSFMTNATGLDTTATSKRFQKARIVHTKRGKRASDKAKRHRQTRKTRRLAKQQALEDKNAKASYEDKIAKKEEDDMAKKLESDAKAAADALSKERDRQDGERVLYRPPILPD